MMLIVTSNKGLFSNLFEGSQNKFHQKTNFICCSSRMLNLSQNSEILGLHSGANMKLSTKSAVLANCLKTIDFP